MTKIGPCCGERPFYDF